MQNGDGEERWLGFGDWQGWMRLCSLRIAKANSYTLGDLTGNSDMRQSKQPPRHHSNIFLIVFIIAQFVAFLVGTSLALSFDVTPVRAFGIGAACWGVMGLGGGFLLWRGKWK